MSEFSYTAHITGLKELYGSMKKLPVTIGTFDHIYNKVLSSVIFDTSDSANGWKITFMNKGNGEVLILPVAVGYRLEINGNETYSRFIKYFNISGKKGDFHIKDFVDKFNSQIPHTYSVTEKTREDILKYRSDGEGKYPIGTRNWQIYHALHPEIPDDKFHRSPENLAKTQNCYPEIYEATKNMDLTIIYGKSPGKYTNAIVNCSHDWKVDVTE